MSTKTFLILDDYYKNIKYKIKVEQPENRTTCYSLYRSENSEWSDHVKNEKILIVEDTGNGLILQWEEKVKKHNLDYSQADELRLILNFINSQSHMPSNYIAFAEKDSIKL